MLTLKANTKNVIKFIKLNSNTMKTTLLTTLFLFVISGVFGQVIEVAGGINRNSSFDLEEDSHFFGIYRNNFGYSFSISLRNDEQQESQNMALSIPFLKKIAIFVDNYSGHFQAGYGFLGGGYSTSTAINKTIMGIGVYPTGIRIKKKFSIILGGELSFLLNERRTGYTSSWSLTTAGIPSYGSIENKTLSNFVNFGISSIISYDIPLTKNWCISPQYKFQFGLLSDMFFPYDISIMSMRQSFSIGVFNRNFGLKK